MTDGFIVRYSLDLQTIQALTYFGGSGHDSVGDMIIDDAGNILFNGVAGDGGIETTSDAEQKKASGTYLAIMSSDLSSLIYSTYTPIAGAITPAGGSNIYLSGSVSGSANVPVGADAFDTTYNGGATDGYIALYQIAGGTGGGGNPAPGDNTAPTADAGPD